LSAAFATSRSVRLSVYPSVRLTVRRTSESRQNGSKISKYALHQTIVKELNKQRYLELM